MGGGAEGRDVLKILQVVVIARAQITSHVTA